MKEQVNPLFFQPFNYPIKVSYFRFECTFKTDFHHKLTSKHLLMMMRRKCENSRTMKVSESERANSFFTPNLKVSESESVRISLNLGKF